jgi:hypothetical protein
LERDATKRLGSTYGAIEVKNHRCFNFNWKRIENGIEEPPFLPDVRLFISYRI